MKLNELKYTKGSKKDIKRLGRGSSSGTGKTSGRGQNGQNSRSGGGVRVGFEGGQMPLYRRIARRGFSNYWFKKEFAIVNLRDLEARFADGETVNKETLVLKGLANKADELIKVLGDGELTKKLTVAVDKVSASAKEKIEKAGGSVTEK